MALSSSLLDVLLCLLPVMFISLHINCKLHSYVACINSLYYVMRETFFVNTGTIQEYAQHSHGKR